MQCLTQLGRVEEIDAFREAVIAVHKDNWRLLQAAAMSYVNDAVHFGFIIAGEFHRGQHPGGGQYAGSFERDRGRGLQLLLQGLDRARKDPDRPAAGSYLLSLADALLQNRVGGGAYQLQRLTPVDTLPDYDEPGTGIWGGGQTGDPVEADGSPVFYYTPRDFSQARNDGERWRWALSQAAEVDPNRLNQTRFRLASFLLGQFGTQTFNDSMSRWNSWWAGDRSTVPTDPHLLESLKDEETMARLATGVKRFTVPDEFNPIKIFQKIADDKATGQGAEALGALAVDLHEPPPVRPGRFLPDTEQAGIW